MCQSRVCVSVSACGSNSKHWFTTSFRLPATTAVSSYAIGARKLSANVQFFAGSQTVVSLLQTTQIISDVCFITDDVAYASSNKTLPKSLNREDGTLFIFIFYFLPGVSCLRACLCLVMFTCVLGR